MLEYCWGVRGGIVSDLRAGVPGDWTSEWASATANLIETATLIREMAGAQAPHAPTIILMLHRSPQVFGRWLQISTLAAQYILVAATRSLIFCTSLVPGFRLGSSGAGPHLIAGMPISARIVKSA